MKIYTIRWNLMKRNRLEESGIFETAYTDERKAVKAMKRSVEEEREYWAEDGEKELEVIYDGPQGADSELPDFARLKAKGGRAEEWFIDEIHVK